MSATPPWLRRRPASGELASPSFLPLPDTTMRPLFSRDARTQSPDASAMSPESGRGSGAAADTTAAQAARHFSADAFPRGERGLDRKGADELGRAIAALVKAQRSLVEQARTEAVELALVLLKNLVGATESMSADKLLEVAREALQAAGPATPLVMRVHPDDVAVLQESAPALLGASNITLRGDATLKRGDIIVETEAGRIDGTLGARLERLERSVRSSMDGPT